MNTWIHTTWENSPSDYVSVCMRFSFGRRKSWATCNLKPIHSGFWRTMHFLVEKKRKKKETSEIKSDKMSLVLLLSFLMRLKKSWEIRYRVCHWAATRVLQINHISICIRLPFQNAFASLNSLLFTLFFLNSFLHIMRLCYFNHLRWYQTVKCSSITWSQLEITITVL